MKRLFLENFSFAMSDCYDFYETILSFQEWRNNIWLTAFRLFFIKYRMFLLNISHRSVYLDNYK